MGQFAVNDVKVGPANAAGANLDPDFTVRGRRIGPFNETKRLPLPFQYHRAH
jgi:hypothetical protein